MDEDLLNWYYAQNQLMSKATMGRICGTKSTTVSKWIKSKKLKIKKDPSGLELIEPESAKLFFLTRKLEACEKEAKGSK